MEGAGRVRACVSACGCRRLKRTQGAVQRLPVTGRPTRLASAARVAGQLNDCWRAASRRVSAPTPRPRVAGWTTSSCSSPPSTSARLTGLALKIPTHNWTLGRPMAAPSRCARAASSRSTPARSDSWASSRGRAWTSRGMVLLDCWLVRQAGGPYNSRPAVGLQGLFLRRRHFLWRFS